YDHHGRGETGPIRLEPQMARQEVAVTVHIRVLRPGRAAEIVQVMVIMQLREHDLADQENNRQQVSQELVVRENLQEQHQGPDQQELQTLRRNVGQIQSRLD